MDSRNPLNPYSQSPSYVGLLHSQNFPYESYHSTVNFGESEIPPFSSQETDAPAVCENTPVACRERKKWTPADDEVIISAWIYTSKDPVVGNPQKSGTFWKRMAHEIYFADHKKKFTLEHSWCVLRHEHKWLSLNTPKPTGSSKRKACETGSQSSGTNTYCHVWKWWDVAVMEEMTDRDKHILLLEEKVDNLTFMTDCETEEKVVRLEKLVCDLAKKKSSFINGFEVFVGVMLIVLVLIGLVIVFK
ncbi:hypothetical protein Bca101_043337 [Brassica carinata]